MSESEAPVYIELNDFPKIKEVIRTIIVIDEEDYDELQEFDKVCNYMLKELHPWMFKETEVFLNTLRPEEFTYFINWETNVFHSNEAKTPKEKATMFFDAIHVFNRLVTI